MSARSFCSGFAPTDADDEPVEGQSAAMPAEPSQSLGQNLGGPDLSAIQRHSYAPPASTRISGLIGTGLVAILLGIGFTLTWTQFVPRPRPAAPLIVSLLPLASPPERPRSEKPKRIVEDRQVAKTPRASAEPVEVTVVPLGPPAPRPPEMSRPTSAPTSEPVEPVQMPALVAPPAPQPASNAPDSWEGRVLARLQTVRRYPAPARSGHQQGIVYVRFGLDRDGHPLSPTLVRSSGFPALDQAALDTVRRADPLPRVPPDRPVPVEISVPIEFFIR